MSYSKTYTDLLVTAQAAAKRGGCKFGNSYYKTCRLAPDDPTKVEVGFYWHAGERVPCVKTNYKGEKYNDTKNKPLPRRDNYFSRMLILDPKGVTVLLNDRPPEEFFEETKKKYPLYQASHWRPPADARPYVDVKLNNLLWELGIHVQHVGAREMEFQGFLWGTCTRQGSWNVSAKMDGTVRIIGDVYIDGESWAVTPLTPQPSRVVDDDLRKTVNKRLMAAYKRLRTLETMGAGPTLAEIKAASGNDLVIRAYLNTGVTLYKENEVAVSERTAALKDAERLLYLLENIDFSDQAQVHELYLRLTFVRVRWFQMRNTWHEVVESAWRNFGPVNGVNQQYRESIRRVLQRVLGVVKYV